MRQARRQASPGRSALRERASLTSAVLLMPPARNVSSRACPHPSRSDERATLPRKREREETDEVRSPSRLREREETDEVRSLSRLRGRVGVGVYPQALIFHAASASCPSQARTRASGSACWVTSLTTAIESAPAAKISRACSSLMPPIATSGSEPTRFFHSVILGMPCGANRIDFSVVGKIGPSAI